MLVGRLRDGRVTVLFADMVAGGRGASRRWHPNGRRSRFNPCMPGWFGVGRLACGLYTVKWRLQLRCGRCKVVLAASWSARSAWVSLRRCRRSYCRMLFVRPTRPCRRWPVASWLVQGRRSAVSQRWLAASVMVELRCSVVSVGMVPGGRGAPRCRLLVGCRTRFDPCMPAAAVWLVRGCLDRLMVCWICVHSVALLPVVLSSNPAHVVGMFVPAVVSCFLVCPSVVYGSLWTLVGPVRGGRVAVFRCVRGHGVSSSLDVVLVPAHARPASLVLAGVRAVC